MGKSKSWPKCPGIFRVILALFVVWSGHHCFGAGRAHADCTLTSTNKVPINDLGSGLYLGQPGGLYPGDTNLPPPAYAASAAAQAAQIVPRDPNGNPDAQNGRIVFISVGMSNTAQEFLSGGAGSFMSRMQSDTSKNPKVDILNCALGAHSALDWTSPADSAWTNMEQVLFNANRDPRQVQVVWMKHADRIGQAPDQSFPAHALWHQANLEIILQMLQDVFPNLKIAFLSSRTRSYAMLGQGSSPEPIAYESGFSVKWLIEKQINGDAALNYDPNLGTVEAPLVVWGPYLWTDGLDPRSDGFTWACSDLQADFTHPAPTGVTKVADQLIAFFKTDPLTRNWFLRTSVIGQPPTVTLNADVFSGPAPLSINFDAIAADSDGSIVQTVWTFGDGGFSLSPSPGKSYPVPGMYSVNLTVTDDDGNPVATSVTVSAFASGMVPTLNTWGVVIMLLAVVLVATLVLRTLPYQDARNQRASRAPLGT